MAGWDSNIDSLCSGNLLQPLHRHQTSLKVSMAVSRNNSDQTRSRQGQAWEFAIWTLVYVLELILWTRDDSGLPNGPLLLTL